MQFFIFGRSRIRKAFRDAVGDRNIPMISGLLQTHPWLTKLRDAKGWTPLHAAAANGFDDITQILLDRGMDPNVTDRYGRTALHISTAQGHVEVVRVLVESGADLNVQDKEGNTPLHLAFLLRLSSLARYLIENGASLTVANRVGDRPADMARDEAWVRAIVSNE